MFFITFSLTYICLTGLSECFQLSSCLCETETSMSVDSCSITLRGRLITHMLQTAAAFQPCNIKSFTFICQLQGYTQGPLLFPPSPISRHRSAAPLYCRMRRYHFEKNIVGHKKMVYGLNFQWVVGHALQGACILNVSTPYCLVTVSHFKLPPIPSLGIHSADCTLQKISFQFHLFTPNELWESQAASVALDFEKALSIWPNAQVLKWRSVSGAPLGFLLGVTWIIPLAQRNPSSPRSPANKQVLPFTYNEEWRQWR